MQTFSYFLLSMAVATAADYPSARISNGQIEMKLYVPAGDGSSYQGTRFDWSGIVYSLRYSGHEFTGRWYPTHDPKIHDALTGPVEEFLAPGESAHGYAEAQPGGTFVRIGVGVVRKPAGESKYQRFQTYEIVDPGSRTFHQSSNAAVFEHELKHESGFGYRYTKTIRVAKDKPEFTLEHVLRNTGTRVIETDQYNHNFFVIDDKTTGPGVSIVFPFQPKAARDLEGRAEIRGHALLFLRELNPGGESVSTEIEGFGPTAADYDLRIENRKAGAGVRIRGDQPLSKIFFWSIRTVACPEPYIRLRVEPGQEARWTITYELYEIR
jgi:hypothetical protein